MKNFLTAERTIIWRKKLKELEKMTHEFVNTMMGKQSKEEAIKKNIERKAIVVENVPPITADTELEFIKYRLNPWNDQKDKILPLLITDLVQNSLQVTRAK